MRFNVVPARWVTPDRLVGAMYDLCIRILKPNYIPRNSKNWPDFEVSPRPVDYQDSTLGLEDVKKHQFSRFAFFAGHGTRIELRRETITAALQGSVGTS